MKIAFILLFGLWLSGCGTGTEPPHESSIPTLKEGSKLWYNTVWQWGEFENDIDSSWAHELLSIQATASGRDSVLAFEDVFDRSMLFYDVDTAGNFFFLVSTHQTGRPELGGEWILLPASGTSQQILFDSSWGFGSERKYQATFLGTGSTKVGDVKLPTRKFSVLVFDVTGHNGGADELSLMNQSEIEVSMDLGVIVRSTEFNVNDGSPGWGIALRKIEP